MTYRVILMPEAFADLDKIAAYIHQHSPQNAADVADRIVRAIDSLEVMPGRFKRVGTSDKRRTPVHAMVVHPFIVYYRIEVAAHAVVVHTIVHGAQRQPRHFQ